MFDANTMIDLLGGTNKVAKLVGQSPASVSIWRGKEVIPEGHLIRLAARIESASGGAISRRELFPDDWERIWPELVAFSTRQRKPLATRVRAG